MILQDTCCSDEEAKRRKIVARLVGLADREYDSGSAPLDTYLALVKGGPWDGLHINVPYNQDTVTVQDDMYVYAYQFESVGLFVLADRCDVEREE
jgi:hypothetical protein